MKGGGGGFINFIFGFGGRGLLSLLFWRRVLREKVRNGYKRLSVFEIRIGGVSFSFCRRWLIGFVRVGFSWVLAGLRLISWCFGGISCRYRS